LEVTFSKVESINFWGIIFTEDQGAVPSDYPGDLPGWDLVWFDEFDRPLDLAMWDVLDYAANTNGELPLWDVANCYTEDSHLVIVSKAEQKGGRRFTSGKLLSKAPYHMHYGRLEVRMKAEWARGAWPSAWLMPVGSERDQGNGQYGQWPKSGEIDVIELISNDGFGQAHTTIHYYAASNNWWGGGGHAMNGHHTAGSYNDVWVTYVIEWDAWGIKWFIEGELAHEAKHDKPFDKPFFLMLQTAISGGGWVERAREEDYPIRTYFDFVRVYKRSDGKDIATAD
ncbi:unnamed protein product, partial [Chrysoparadoxa australica]